MLPLRSAVKSFSTVLVARHADRRGLRRLSSSQLSIAATRSSSNSSSRSSQRSSSALSDSDDSGQQELLRAEALGRMFAPRFVSASASVCSADTDTGSSRSSLISSSSWSLNTTSETVTSVLFKRKPASLEWLGSSGTAAVNHTSLAAHDDESNHDDCRTQTGNRFLIN